MRLVAVFVLLTACLSPPVYECASSAQCGTETCEPDASGHHFCAAADATCTSGARFDPSAGGDAGACTGAPLRAGRSASVCLPGSRFPADFTSCTEAVCAALPTCCDAGWGTECVTEAEMKCEAPCGRQLAFAGLGGVAIAADDDGDGTYAQVASLTAADEHFDAVQWADLTGDGAPSLLVGTYDNEMFGSLQTIYGFDGKTLATAQDLRTLLDDDGGTPLDPFETCAISVGDYDDDGWADVAWIGTAPMFVALHNPGAGGATLANGFAYPTSPASLQQQFAQGIGWADVNGDGLLDLTLGSTISGDLWVLTRQPDGSFGVWHDTLPNEVAWGGWGDLDGDGQLDLVVVGDQYARLYHNDHGTLTLDPTFGPEQVFSSGTWIDVDGDGNQDLALTVEDGPLEIYMSNGKTLVSGGWTSTELQEAPGMIAADVNGDGKLDLAIANNDPDPPCTYVNQGDGTFERHLVTGLTGAQWAAVSSTSRTAPTR